MINIGLLMEKIRVGDQLLPGEAQALAREVTRARERQAACAEEITRREEIDKAKRQESREFAERARAAEEEVERLREALQHAKTKASTDAAALADRVTHLEEILRDVHYGLSYQPELTREELANVITTIVTPHRKPMNGGST